MKNGVKNIQAAAYNVARLLGSYFLSSKYQIITTSYLAMYKKEGKKNKGNRLKNEHIGKDLLIPLC